MSAFGSRSLKKYIDLLERLPVEPKAKYDEFAGLSSRGKSLVGYSNLSGDEHTRVFFTFSDWTDSVFVSVSNARVDEFSQLLARLEAYSDAAVKIGHVVRMESDYLQENGRVGFVMLPVDTVGYFSAIPESAQLDGYYVSFLLAVLISQQEYEVWARQGYAGLLGHFDKVNKDLVSIRCDT